jgi:hypothetical protein
MAHNNTRDLRRSGSVLLYEAAADRGGCATGAPPRHCEPSLPASRGGAETDDATM